MSSLRSLVTRHPLKSYFGLTFLISWSGVLFVVGGPAGLPGVPEVTAKQLPYGIMALVAGPSIAGILLTYIIHGGPGLRRLFGGMLQWRRGLRWYAFAVLITPLCAGTLLWVLSKLSPEFLPGIVVTEDKGALLLSALLAGAVAGLFEEVGWTGFAIPELRNHQGVLATGLIVGFLWGGWHYIAAIWGGGDAQGAFSVDRFLPQFVFYVVVLPVFRVLMVWVHDRTDSLLVIMLMHASLTANTIFIFMPVAGGEAMSVYYLLLALSFWLVIAAVALANGGRLDRSARLQGPADISAA